MLSSSGNERLTPRPRKTVRRDKCFLVMNIAQSSANNFAGALSPAFGDSGCCSRDRVAIGHRPHLEWHALDDCQHSLRPAVVIGCRLSYDLTHRGPIKMLHAPAKRIREQLFDNGPGELVTPIQ